MEEAPPLNPLKWAYIRFTVVGRKPRVSFEEDENVLEIDGGDGCTTI